MKRAKFIPGAVLTLCLTAGLLTTTAFAAAHPFTDVPDTAWYNGAVQYVYENGMMSGTGGGAFSPETPLSRGMLVTILHRVDGLPAAGNALSFADVPDGQWYTDAVAWASSYGIVSGDGVNFMPDTPITREQLAAILYRYAGYKGYDTAISGEAGAFPDGDTVSPYATGAVNWAIGVGLLQGSDGLLSPTGGATRAQAASMLMRFCEDIASSDSLTVVSALDAMDVMCEPSGILFLEDGSFLVTDVYNKRIWQVKNGTSTVYAGGETVTDPYNRPIGGYNDAELKKSYFKLPWAIAPFLDGYAVSDADNDVVRLLRAGNTQTLNASTEEKLPVTKQGVAFSHPTGLAADEAGNLYVSDTYEGEVRKITPEGVLTTYATDLAEPMGLCWKDGILYIAETGANRIVKVVDGRIDVVAGGGAEGLTDGPAAQAAFYAPQGVAVGEDGTVYVSDTANSAVRQIKNGVVSTLARRDKNDLTSFIPNSPVGLVLRGNQLYVCDTFARKIFVISLGS